MIRGRSAGVAFVVCVVAGALVGCDGRAESQPTTSAVASPSGSTSASVPSSALPSTPVRPTPTSTATASVPAAARAHTTTGAETFVRFYLELVDQAWSAPDAALLRPFVLKTCKSCANQIATAQELETRRLSYRGRASRLGESIVLPESDPSMAVIRVNYAQLPQQIIDRSGNVVERVGRDTALLEIRAAWTPPGRWRIATIKVVRL